MRGNATSEAAEPFPARRFGAGAWALVVVLWLAAVLIATYPLVRHLGEATPGTPGDAGLYLWCMDTFWTELGAGRNPLFTDRVLFPRGANLAHASCPTLLSLFSLPFLSHLLLYSSLVTILSLLAAAVGMMLVVRELTADDAAAAIAGLLYGLSPPSLSYLWASQFQFVTAAALLPFGVLCLLRFTRTASVGALVGLSAVLWALVFTNPYATVTLLIVVVAMGTVLVPSRWRARHLRRAAVVGVANAVLGLAITTWWFSPGDASDVVRGGYVFTSSSNVNLADLLVPGASNPVLGALHDAWSFDNNGDVRSYFLGWGILALAVGAAVRRWRDPEIVALAAAGVAVVVFACGTAIRIGSRTLLEQTWTPFDWFNHVPYLMLLDAPRRLVVGASLAVVALAGVGVAALAARRRGRQWILLGALLLALVEYGHFRVPVTLVVVPQVYRHLAAEPDGRAVLELGAGIASSNKYLGLDYGTPSGLGMFWQTVHRKPRVSGYMARVPRSTYDWFSTAPIMSDILKMTHLGKGEWPDRSYSKEEVETFLRTFNLGYVIIKAHGPHELYTRVIETLLAGHIARMEIVEGSRLYVLTDERTGPAPSGKGSTD